MDTPDSSYSSGTKTVTPLLFSDSASSSKETSTPKTPLPFPRPYRRRSGLSRVASNDGDDMKHHHNVLSFMFLLAVVALFMMWSLDICCMSFAKRMVAGPATRVYSRRPTASPPSVPPPTNSVEVHLDGVATEAKNSVVEFFETAGNFRCPQPRRYSRDEVARHDTADDLWIVIDGNVLDVSPFVGQHPGGLVLLDGAGGQDMATVFARSHHPSTVSLFSSFCIGRVAGE